MILEHFSNSGAEANEGAIKIARKYGETKFENKRYKVITLEHFFMEELSQQLKQLVKIYAYTKFCSISRWFFISQ